MGFDASKHHGQDNALISDICGLNKNRCGGIGSWYRGHRRERERVQALGLCILCGEQSKLRT